MYGLLDQLLVAAKVIQSFSKKNVAFNHNSNRQTMVKERKDSDRIGIFFCRFGLSTQLNIDCDDVIQFIEKTNGNFYVGELEYGCNTTGKKSIINAVAEENLGRIIIAPCYAEKAHLTMFQQLIQSVGLSGNKLTIFDAGERNHGWNSEDLKQKLMDLIKSEEKATSPEEPGITITTEAAVIGNSITALQAALDIAKLGYKAHLLIPGSASARSYHNIFWHSDNIIEKSESLIEQVSNHSNIELYKESQVERLEGKPGNYKLVFNENGKAKYVITGAIVLAPGAQPYQPSEFSYNENRHVITQGELAEFISEDNFSFKKIVMIQCVGSRQSARQYCSQICCEQAIKNAIKIKQVQPDAEIHILHRDIRVYDFKEDYYTEAIEQGIKFIRMDKTPEVRPDNGTFHLKVVDRLSQQLVALECDLLVLSNGIIPGVDNQKISDIMNVSLNGDGFFWENENLMKPLQCNKPGIFMAGLAHSPQRLENALLQAAAVAGKIGVMFRSEKIIM